MEKIKTYLPFAVGTGIASLGAEFSYWAQPNIARAALLTAGVTGLFYAGRETVSWASQVNQMLRSQTPKPE